MTKAEFCRELERIKDNLDGCIERLEEEDDEDLTVVKEVIYLSVCRLNNLYYKEIHNG